MEVRLRSGNAWKSRNEWFSQESYINKIIRSSRSSRCVFRDAFFGDRIGNILSLSDTKLQKKYAMWIYALYIRMYWKRVLSRISHPDIYIDECSELIGKAPNINFDFVKDFIRCKVLPRVIYFTRYSRKGKLFFALCRSCCETFSQATCTHNRPEEFEDTWISCELRKVIGKGYLVTSVSEIWKYKVTRYDPQYTMKKIIR